MNEFGSPKRGGWLTSLEPIWRHKRSASTYSIEELHTHTHTCSMLHRIFVCQLLIYCYHFCLIVIILPNQIAAKINMQMTQSNNKGNNTNISKELT